MKNIILTTMIILSSLSANAALQSGFYSGELDSGAAEKTSVKVFVQSQNQDTAYGLILTKGDNSRGALYYIEELPDGTQSWIHLYQGGGVLRSNADKQSTFKGMPISARDLRLVPADKSSLCQGKVREIHLTKDSGPAWQDFQEMQFTSGERNSNAVLKGLQLMGSLMFEDASFSGTFSLGKIASGLASLRAQVLSPDSLSGWALSREMLGIAVMLKDNSGGFFGGSEVNKLTVIKLPVNQENCLDTTTSIRN